MGTLILEVYRKSEVLVPVLVPNTQASVITTLHIWNILTLRDE